MEHAGTNVLLNISSRCLELTSHDTGELVAKHDMPSISFASGGDSVSTKILIIQLQYLSTFIYFQDTLDFVAYVAKDLMEWRACYVLECDGGKAQNLISTMGQAFELRYNEFYVTSMQV